MYSEIEWKKDFDEFYSKVDELFDVPITRLKIVQDLAGKNLASSDKDIDNIQSDLNNLLKEQEQYQAKIDEINAKIVKSQLTLSYLEQAAEEYFHWDMILVGLISEARKRQVAKHKKINSSDDKPTTNNIA